MVKMKNKMNDRQRKAMFSKLQKGTIVTTPKLHIKGVYAGKTRKGHKILTTSKGRPTIIITKTRPEQK